MAKNEKNEKATQKATNRAVNTKGSMQSGKSSNCNKADNKTTDSVDGCGCGGKNGDGERKK